MVLTVQARADMACHRDPALGEMYALVRSEALLEDRLNRLKHQVSDASLAQMPDFNQRVQVLRQLDYISAEDVVELKVRSCLLPSAAAYALPLALYPPA